MASYAGPQVGPVFVTGVVNDAWAAAQERTAAARASLNGVKPAPIMGSVPDAITAHLQLNPTLAAPGKPRDGAASEISAELMGLLSDFIGAHYPAITMPDPDAAFEAVLQRFDEKDLKRAARDVVDRTGMVWSVRGITIPPEAAAYQGVELGRRLDDALLLQQMNVDVVRQSNMKELAMVGWELAMRTQVEAMDAARTFLIGAVVDIEAKVAQDEAALAGIKQQLAGAFFRMLDAQVESGSVTVDLLALQGRIQVDAALANEDRKAFVFKERVQAALAELESLASQASAAINRVSATASVGGIERTP